MADHNDHNDNNDVLQQQGQQHQHQHHHQHQHQRTHEQQEDEMEEKYKTKRIRQRNTRHIFLEIFGWPDAESDCERIEKKLLKKCCIENTTTTTTTTSTTAAALASNERNTKQKQERLDVTIFMCLSGPSITEQVTIDKIKTATHLLTKCNKLYEELEWNGATISFAMHLREKEHGQSATKPLKLSLDLTLALVEFFHAMAAFRKYLTLFIDHRKHKASSELISFIVNVAGQRLDLIRCIGSAGTEDDIGLPCPDRYECSPRLYRLLRNIRDFCIVEPTEMELCLNKKYSSEFNVAPKDRETVRTLNVSWSVPSAWILEYARNHPTLEKISIMYSLNTDWTDHPKEQNSAMDALGNILSSSRCKIKDLEIYGSTVRLENAHHYERLLTVPPLFPNDSNGGDDDKNANDGASADSNATTFEQILYGNRSLRRLALVEVGLNVEGVDDLLCFLCSSQNNDSGPKIKVLDLRNNYYVDTLNFQNYFNLLERQEKNRKFLWRSTSSVDEEDLSLDSSSCGLVLEELWLNELPIIRRRGNIDFWMEPMWGQYRLMQACPRLHSFGTWKFSDLWNVFEIGNFAAIMTADPRPGYPREKVMDPTRLQQMADLNRFRAIFSRLSQGRISIVALPMILRWLKKRVSGINMSRRRQAALFFQIILADPAMLNVSQLGHSPPDDETKADLEVEVEKGVKPVMQKKLGDESNEKSERRLE